MSYLLGQEQEVYECKLISHEDLIRPPMIGIGSWVIGYDQEETADCEETLTCSDECWRVLTIE